jgi:hypothetical protein
MRTENIILYSFTELDKKAQQKARDWYWTNIEFGWYNEYLKSIKGFCQLFDIKLEDYHLSGDYHAEIKTNAAKVHFADLSPVKVDKLSDDFTGYYADGVLTDSFRQNYSKHQDGLKAFKYAMDKVLRAIRDDVKHHYSDECIVETCDINGWEFTEVGAKW